MASGDGREPGSLQGPLVPAGGTDLRIDCSLERGWTYRDLELYLMGLLPPEEVEPHIVFDGQHQSLACGSVWSGSTTVVTIDDVMTNPFYLATGGRAILDPTLE